MFITRLRMKIIPKWGWIFCFLWRHSCLFYHRLTGYIYLLMPLKSKFVSNCNNRCFHDFFLFWHLISFDSTSNAGTIRARARFWRKISNCLISNFTGNGRVKTIQKISLIRECVLQTRQFKCIYILITNFYWLLHLSIFNTF